LFVPTKKKKFGPPGPHRVDSTGLKLRIPSKNRNYEFTFSSRRFACAFAFGMTEKIPVWGKKKKVKNDRNYEFPCPFSTKIFF
jgi:hypothetical protein